jgi:hypothetical protein
MAFNGDFSITELSTPNVFTITDISASTDGGDPNLTGRTIFLRKADGSLLVPGIAWDIEDDSITLDVLSKDMALDVEVVWASSDMLPDPSTYVHKELKAFTGYGEAFNYRLIQLQSANPSVINTSGYLQHKMELRVALDNARDAVAVGEDIYSAQQMLERSNYLIANEKYFY